MTTAITLRLLGLTAVLVVSATAATSSATAGLACSGQTYVQPFQPWLDPANYVSVQNGALESSSGWTLANGAKLVTGNEPWKVNKSTDSRSLYLPSGSSATSPALCVTLLHPTLRFFATNSGSATAVLRVDVLTDLLGVPTTVTIGVLAAGSWQPTVPLAFLTNLTSAVSGSVRFRFTPVGAGSGFRIDDVYVDPYKQR
jgi:hypothetical protein